MVQSFLQKLRLSALLFLLIPLSFVQASGKMEARLGETVTLEPQDMGINSSYEWVLTNETGEIIYHQIRPVFEYTFLENGEYRVSVKTTDRLGQEKTTTVMILVGDLYNVDRLSGSGGGFGKAPLKVVYSTLPSKTSQNTIPLIGEGTVLFDLAVSRSDLIEYRIDRNIFEDSDGNGIANDDIDNAADDSYLRGGVWETRYKPAEATKIVPEITLVTVEGETAKAQAEVLFQSPPSTASGLLAVLDILPEPRPDDLRVELYEEVQIVGFYTRASQGNILEYRLDENIFVDSDRDGNPANDIDNLDHPSFKTGDVWTTTYQKTNSQIIAQLTVVGEGGRASRIQREVVFTDRPEVDLGPDGKATDIFISTDKSFVLKGNPILFQVEGLTQKPSNYTFHWDLNGDGERDKLVEGDHTLTHLYEEAGVYPVTVLVTDEADNQAELSLEVLVKDTEATTADFEVNVEGTTATFTNKSQAAFNLADKTLRYRWSFGDPEEENFKSQQDQVNVQNPVYTYRYKGSYRVTLEVVDADQVVDTKSIELSIEEGPEAPKEGEAAGGGGKGGAVKLILKILKWAGLVLLLLVVLVLTALAGLMLVLKLKQPDLTFEELVDEVKLKLLALLGVREEELPSSKLQSNEEISQALEEELGASAVEGEVISPETKASEEERKTPALEGEIPVDRLGKMAGDIDFKAPPGTEGPMPEWLKKASRSIPPQEPSVSQAQQKEEPSSKNSSNEEDRPEEKEEDEGEDQGPQDQGGGSGSGGGGQGPLPLAPLAAAGEGAPVPSWLQNTPPPSVTKPIQPPKESPPPTPPTQEKSAPSEEKKAPLPDWLKKAQVSSGPKQEGIEAQDSGKEDSSLGQQRDRTPTLPEPPAPSAAPSLENPSDRPKPPWMQKKPDGEKKPAPLTPPEKIQISEPEASLRAETEEKSASENDPVLPPAPAERSQAVQLSPPPVLIDESQSPADVGPPRKKIPPLAPKEEKPAFSPLKENKEVQGPVPSKEDSSAPKSSLPPWLQPRAEVNPSGPVVSPQEEQKQKPPSPPFSIPLGVEEKEGKKAEEKQLFTPEKKKEEPSSLAQAMPIREPRAQAAGPVGGEGKRKRKRRRKKKPLSQTIPSETASSASTQAPIAEAPPVPLAPQQKLLRDFVSKAPLKEEGVKPKEKFPKTPSPTDSNLPAWLQPSSEKAVVEREIEPERPEENLPEPLPPLKLEKEKPLKVPKETQTPPSAALSEKKEELKEKPGKKEPKNQEALKKKKINSDRPQALPKKKLPLPQGAKNLREGHVEISMEDLRQGGEVNL